MRSVALTATNQRPDTGVVPAGSSLVLPLLQTAPHLPPSATSSSHTCTFRPRQRALYDGANVRESLLPSNGTGSPASGSFLVDASPVVSGGRSNVHHLSWIVEIAVGLAHCLTNMVPSLASSTLRPSSQACQTWLPWLALDPQFLPAHQQKRHPRLLAPTRPLQTVCATTLQGRPPLDLFDSSSSDRTSTTHSSAPLPRTPARPRSVQTPRQPPAAPRPHRLVGCHRELPTPGNLQSLGLDRGD